MSVSFETRSGWIVRCALVAAILAIAIVTAGWTIELVQRAADRNAVADDFKTSVWRPGRALLHGRSPLRHYSDVGHDGGTAYPPIATTATLPFSLPPYQLARVLWMLTLLIAVLASLWLCDVRDWRCYLAACACPPVIVGLAYANVSLLLVLATALAWRWRDRPWFVAALLGLAVAAKLFLWPLVVWLGITRRSRALALTIASFGILSLVGWAAVGFEGAGSYVSLLRRHAADNDQAGVSLAALAAQLGVSANQLIAIAGGLVALTIAFRLRENELGAFSWSVTAALLASPMVWWHYYAVLLVPLALARPGWGPTWLAPFAMFPQAADAVVGTALAVFVSIWASRMGERRRIAPRRALSPRGQLDTSTASYLSRAVGP